MIRIGPSGIGGVHEAVDVIKEYKDLGITAAEIPFTYVDYIKKKEDAKRIGEAAKKYNVSLSIHGSYFINLASNEEEKIAASKKRILSACEKAHYLGATHVVFHAGFYQGKDPEKVFQIIKKEVKELLEEIKKKGWKVKLAPEVTGKASQFGSLDELTRLAKETGCSFCVDFAHVYARDIGKIDYDSVFKKLKEFKHIHSHFTGIEYTQKV